MEMRKNDLGEHKRANQVELYMRGFGMGERCFMCDEEHSASSVLRMSWTDGHLCSEVHLSW